MNLPRISLTHETDADNAGRKNISVLKIYDKHPRWELVWSSFFLFSQLYNFNIRIAILFFVVHAVNRGIFMFCFCLFLYRAVLSVFVRAACDGDLWPCRIFSTGQRNWLVTRLICTIVITEFAPTVLLSTATKYILWQLDTFILQPNAGGVPEDDSSAPRQKHCWPRTVPCLFGDAGRRTLL